PVIPCVVRPLPLSLTVVPLVLKSNRSCRLDLPAKGDRSTCACRQLFVPYICCTSWFEAFGLAVTELLRNVGSSDFVAGVESVGLLDASWVPVCPPSAEIKTRALSVMVAAAALPLPLSVCSR